MEKIKDKTDNLEINENTLRKHIPAGHQIILINFIYLLQIHGFMDF